MFLFPFSCARFCLRTQRFAQMSLNIRPPSVCRHIIHPLLTLITKRAVIISPTLHSIHALLMSDTSLLVFSFLNESPKLVTINPLPLVIQTVRISQIRVLIANQFRKTNEGEGEGHCSANDVKSQSITELPNHPPFWSQHCCSIKLQWIWHGVFKVFRRPRSIHSAFSHIQIDLFELACP